MSEQPITVWCIDPRHPAKRRRVRVGSILDGEIIRRSPRDAGVMLRQDEPASFGEYHRTGRLGDGPMLKEKSAATPNVSGLTRRELRDGAARGDFRHVVPLECPKCRRPQDFRSETLKRAEAVLRHAGRMHLTLPELVAIVQELAEDR